MANVEHLEMLKQGVRFWNKWREENPGITPDLSEANLGQAYLSRMNLNLANLKRANLFAAKLITADLRSADLRRTNLQLVDLRGADLELADLREADLRRADLSESSISVTGLSSDIMERSVSDTVGTNLAGADLRGADLRGVNLKGAYFRRTNIGEALIGWTTFVDVNLSQVEGLETAKHIGPSFISIDTILFSRGKIPPEFMRGAGVPENLIKYLPTLINQTMQYYSCFISYSTKDQEFAERLHADLQNVGIRVWFAPEDIKGGRKLHEQIPDAIRIYDKLLLVLSENSMRSEWVKTEIYHARLDEIRNNKRKLFPIGLVDFGIIRNWEAFDADSGKDMAREIREYFIPDFSTWKDHDAYKKAFDRLLHDLEAEG